MAKDILKLIEAVDPADSDALDEIDCRVSAHFHEQWEFDTVTCGTMPDHPEWELSWRTKVHPNSNKTTIWHSPKYTRSRDALKAIRPEGWWVTYIREDIANFWCVKLAYGNYYIVSPSLPTEELAELHAITQAIEYNYGFTKP